MSSSVRRKFRILNGLAISLFLSAFPVAMVGAPLMGALLGVFAVLVYLVAILIVRCPNCGKFLLVNFYGSFVGPARSPFANKRCPQCGHDLGDI